MEKLSADHIPITLGNSKKHGIGAFYLPYCPVEYQPRRSCGDPPRATVGIGGSITIREMGLPEALIGKPGQTVHDHWREESPAARHAIGRLQQQSDCFLTSTNAVTMNGELVNVDASGNRVASA